MVPEKLPRDMGFWQFWWESVKHSFTKAWIGVLAVSGALAILIPCARLLSSSPRYQTFFDILEHYWTGWILIIAFFLILFARVVYAPFLIYEQAAGEIATTEAEREELRDQLATQRDTKAAKDRFSKHMKAMSNLWAEGKGVLDNLFNADSDFDLVKSESSDWYQRVLSYLKKYGASDDANYFDHCDDGADEIPAYFNPRSQRERNWICHGVQQRVRNLRVIIDRTKPPS